MIKIIPISILFYSSLLLSNNFKISNNVFQVENKTITILENIKLEESEKNFPLDIVGKYVKRKYIIRTEKELKQAIYDFNTKEFSEIEIQCIFRDHCQIDKDLSFISTLYQNPEIDNKITLVTPTERIKFTNKEFLKKPFILIRDFMDFDLKSIKNTKINEKKLNIFKNKWDKMEQEKNKNILTNMFIRKFLYSDFILYKQIINDENIPHFLSSIIGSKYCEVRIGDSSIITNKKCDIPIYSYKKMNTNNLFINGFFYIGEITNKIVKKDKIIYSIANNLDIKNNVYMYNEDFGQKNLNYFTNIINIKMKNKDQFNKYFFNQNENKEFDIKRAKKLKEILNNNKVFGSENLYKLFFNKMKEDNTKEYRH